MNLRKCTVFTPDCDGIDGMCHGLVQRNGGSYYAVEMPNGWVELREIEEVKFLEPARQRVEVTVNDKPTQTGCLVGWYQYGNGDVSGPAALVLHDDGKHRIYDETQVRIIKEVENE